MTQAEGAGLRFRDDEVAGRLAAVRLRDEADAVVRWVARVEGGVGRYSVSEVEAATRRLAELRAALEGLRGRDLDHCTRAALRDAHIAVIDAMFALWRVTVALG